MVEKTGITFTSGGEIGDFKTEHPWAYRFNKWNQPAFWMNVVLFSVATGALYFTIPTPYTAIIFAGATMTLFGRLTMSVLMPLYLKRAHASRDFSVGDTSQRDVLNKRIQVIAVSNMIFSGTGTFVSSIGVLCFAISAQWLSF
jgi:hypothetical protein|tara:strand:+ start:181 stop:609 length:429 start_codon:yes stop_codon:yes gene_type:complete